MIEIHIIISLIFGFWGLINESRLIIRTRNLLISNLFFIMYIITYALLPAYFLYKYLNNPNDPSLKFLNNNTGVLFLWQLFSLLVFILIKIVAKQRCFLTNYIITKIKYGVKDIKALQYTAVIALIIGIICLYLWASAFGGFIQLVLLGNAIRAGYGNINSPLTVFMRPATILLLTTLLFIWLLKNRKDAKLFNTFGLLLSIFFSFIYLLANDGRFTTAIYILLILFAIFNFFKVGTITKRKLLLLIVFSLSALLLISAMDSITGFIREKDNNNITSENNFIIKEFSYIYITGIHVTNRILSFDGTWLLMNDFIGGLLAWVPMRFHPSTWISIWNYNTNDIYGENVTGQLPSDFISTSLYDASFLGLFIISIFWGIIIKKINSIRYSNSSFSEPLYCYLSFMMIRVPNYFELYDTIGGLFPVFVVYIIYRMVKLFI